MATVTADEVRVALRRHYGLASSDLATEEWTLHDEVGIARWGGQIIDVLAIRAWGGRPKGHERHAIEIKVSRGDFLRELRAEKWRGWFDVVHRFYFAAPAGLLRLNEIPEGCGLITVDTPGCRKMIEAPRREPAPLDESVWIELARRASRLAERMRRPDDPVAELAAAQIRLRKLEAAADRATEREDRIRERLGLLIAALPDADVVCDRCRMSMMFEKTARLPWRWVHPDEQQPSDGASYRYCGGQPIPRDLLEPESATA